jgi:DNA replication and repair protein RecF
LKYKIFNFSQTPHPDKIIGREKAQRTLYQYFSIICTHVKKVIVKQQTPQYQQALKMYLKKISLFNYKNFSEANFEFDGKIICL